MYLTSKPNVPSVFPLALKTEISAEPKLPVVLIRGPLVPAKISLSAVIEASLDFSTISEGVVAFVKRLPSLTSMSVLPVPPEFTCTISNALSGEPPTGLVSTLKETFESLASSD